MTEIYESEGEYQLKEMRMRLLEKEFQYLDSLTEEILDQITDPEHYWAALSSLGCWQTKNGYRIKIPKIPDDHLLNIIRFLLGKGESSCKMPTVSRITYLRQMTIEAKKRKLKFISLFQTVSILQDPDVI